MGRVTRKNDNRAGRIGFQLTCVEFIAQAYIKDARNYGVDAILRVLMRHELRALGRFDPDGVGGRLRRVTYQNGEADRRWEGRERFPFDVIRQDEFECILTRLVSPGFALQSSL